nr:glutamate synthase subunit alpha [Bacteroidales bacterium]
CPVGVATQNPELRKHFMGKSEYLVNYYTFLAREVREYLAEMGFRKFEDIIGRSDLISVDTARFNDKTAGLDFSRILAAPVPDAPLHKQKDAKHNIYNVLDREMIEATRYAVENKQPVSLSYDIVNTNRATGAMLSGTIAGRYGCEGLPEGTVDIRFRGSAGQSFGAFLMKGVTFSLEGEANDYLGKGLSGGVISVFPPVRSTFDSHENIIAGNTLLYGATSGKVFISGRAGERFAVRNSGAIAVVEGTGDHCCEYMTGGRVVVLGTTGRNFAAGMSGGLAYVWDKDHNFDQFCNMDMIELSLIEEKVREKELYSLIEEHFRRTGSPLAQQMLTHWKEYVEDFIQITPIEYRRVLQEETMKKLQEKINKIEY